MFALMTPPANRAYTRSREVQGQQSRSEGSLQLVESSVSQMVWNFSSSGDRCERQTPSTAKHGMGQSPEANLVAPILLVVNTEAKEVSNRMVSFGNKRPCMERVQGTLV